MARVSTGVDAKVYIPVKVPTSRESHIKAIAFGLEAGNTVLPSPLCVDPMLPLVATLEDLKTMLESNFMASKDKEQVTEAGDYHAKQLVTIVTLVDKTMPMVVALYDAILCTKAGRHTGLGKTLLFDIACGLAHRVFSLSKWS